jgi:hypothetical protein
MKFIKIIVIIIVLQQSFLVAMLFVERNMAQHRCFIFHVVAKEHVLLEFQATFLAAHEGFVRMLKLFLGHQGTPWALSPLALSLPITY